MQAIIAALLAAVIPILAKVLQDWISSLFAKVAPTVAETGDTATDATALVNAALADTPHRHFLKRAFLRRFATVAGDTAINGTIDPAHVPALAALAESMPESATAA